MFDLGTIGGAVTLDNSKFNASLAQMQNKTMTTMQFIGNYVAGNIAVGLGQSFKRFGVESVKSMMELEGELANIASIADVGKENIKAGLMEMSDAFGSPIDNAKAMYYAFSSGITGTEQQMVNFTGTVAALSKATVTDQSSTMDAITTLMNSYKMSVDRASEASDFFFQVVKLGKSTGPELAQSLGMVTNSAALGGVSLNELGASIATLSRTMPTALAITSLNQVINGFIMPTKEAKAAAAALGIELTADALKQKGFAAAIAEVNAKAGDNVEALAMMFGEIRAFRGVAALAGTQSAEFADALAQFGEKGGSMMAAFAVQTDNVKATWEESMVAMEKALINLGDALAPVVSTLAGFVSSMSSSFQGLSGSTIILDALGAGIGLLSVKFIGMGAAAGNAAMQTASATVAAQAYSIELARTANMAASFGAGGFTSAISNVKTLNTAMGSFPIGMITPQLKQAELGFIGMSKQALSVPGTFKAIGGAMGALQLAAFAPMVWDMGYAFGEWLAKLGPVKAALDGIGNALYGMSKAEKQTEADLDKRIAALPKLGTRAKDEEKAKALEPPPEIVRTAEQIEADRSAGLAQTLNAGWENIIGEEKSGQDKIKLMRAKFDYAMATGAMDDEKTRLEMEIAIRETERRQILALIEETNALKAEAVKSGLQEESDALTEKLSEMSGKAAQAYDDIKSSYSKIAGLGEVDTASKIKRLQTAYDAISQKGSGATDDEKRSMGAIGTEIGNLNIQKSREDSAKIISDIVSKPATGEKPQDIVLKSNGDLLKANLEHKKVSSEMSGYMKSMNDIMAKMLESIKIDIKLDPATAI